MFAPVKLVSMIFAAALSITSVASAASSCTEEDFSKTYPDRIISVDEVHKQSKEIHDELVAIIKVNVPSRNRCSTGIITRVNSLVKRSDCLVKVVQINYHYKIEDSDYSKDFDVINRAIQTKARVEVINSPLLGSYCGITNQEEYLEVLSKGIGNLALVRSLAK